MSDPLLSSLCRICHINAPKYTCPRCSQQTCSLACSKRHKLWADCNGIRDPTAYKPMRELATPAGIDHDYNFISRIERGIERSDKRIVQEKGLVNVKELFEGARPTRHYYDGGDNLSRAFRNSAVRVVRAPKGMKRQTDNHTKWSNGEKCLNWQVEWQLENNERVLGKALETKPIGEVYALMVHEETLRNLAPAAKKQYKKRRFEDTEERKADTKRNKAEHSIIPNLVDTAAFQNHESSAWNLIFPSDPQANESSRNEFEDNQPFVDTFVTSSSAYNSWESSSNCYFYLHRPYTPSSYLRVVTPLHPSWSLKSILQNRIVQEFPTIYALTSSPISLPDNFMLECDFLAAQRKTVHGHSSDGDFDMEDGEIK